MAYTCYLRLPNFASNAHCKKRRSSFITSVTEPVRGFDSTIRLLPPNPTSEEGYDQISHLTLSFIRRADSVLLLHMAEEGDYRDLYFILSHAIALGKPYAVIHRDGLNPELQNHLENLHVTAFSGPVVLSVDDLVENPSVLQGLLSESRPADLTMDVSTLNTQIRALESSLPARLNLKGWPARSYYLNWTLSICRL